jgi:hypothetical protein
MNPKGNIKYKLEDIEKKTPFKVPDNYFDTFQSRMADRIAAEEAKKQFRHAFSIPKLRLVPLVAAVSIVLIAIGILWVAPLLKNMPTDRELAEIYRYQAIEATSESDLIRELETLSLETEKKDSVITKKDVITEEAIDALSNENIDINSIIEAL